MLGPSLSFNTVRMAVTTRGSVVTEGPINRALSQGWTFPPSGSYYCNNGNIGSAYGPDPGTLILPLAQH